MAETTVGIRALKTQLSHYLQRVKGGESLIITERGMPIGRIVPTGRDLHSRLQGMVAAGQCAWNGKRYVPGEPVAVNRGSGTLADLVAEERDHEPDLS
ncbi:MAG TPA: type II toxin-antitoxin system prevent-host-death family antitoxin [Anaerolineae bacterium]|nr:type II toxin-antitoxin system prevent-host-death family antitoxin [Anaerolineae bacterium]HQI83561.1 type II toxin-antitoxin system prevent-host-death family antitoxin [Anaerolineae bacterium]